MFSTGQSWFNDSETVLDYDQAPTPIHAKVDWGETVDIKIKDAVPEVTRLCLAQQKQHFTIWFFPLVFLLFLMACIVYFMYY